VNARNQLRIGILCDPVSTARGVGPDVVEALLTTWLKTPIALGHREDGSPFVIGIDGWHLSLSHAVGCTAIVLDDGPVGIDICEISSNRADRKVAAKLFSSSERKWLFDLPPDEQAEGFAQVWTLKEAILKRDRQGLSRHDLPNVGDILATSFGPPAALTPEWRPWIALGQSNSGRAHAPGLLLAMPGALMMPERKNRISGEIFETPTGLLALSLAWTTV
jgi:hypothetical protein